MIRLVEQSDGWFLEVGEGWGKPSNCSLVTSALLGKAAVTGQAYVQHDGSGYRLARDFHGVQRNESTLLPGPFGRFISDGDLIKDWPPSKIK